MSFELLESGSARLGETATTLRALESYSPGGVVYSDDFNRADTTAPGLGAPWVASNYYISSNQARRDTGTGTFNDMAIYGVSLGSDHWVEADVTHNSHYGVLRVRAQNNASSWKDYEIYWHPASSTFRMAVSTDDAGSFTVLATSGVISPGATFKLRLEASGSTITGYLNGTQILQATDSTYSGAAYSYTGLAVDAQASPALIDNFRCGPMPYVSLPFVVAVTANTLGAGALTVNKPAGGQTGDYYVLWYEVGDYLLTAPPPNPACTGFTLEPGGVKGIQNVHAAYLWRPYDGTEGSTFTITGTDSSHWSGMVCWLLRGLSAGWKPGIAHVGARGGDVTIQSVYAKANTLMLVTYKDWNASRPNARPAVWTEVIYNSAFTGYSYVPAAGYTTKSTISPSGGSTNSLASVLYITNPQVWTDPFDRSYDTAGYAAGNTGDGLGGEWGGGDGWGVTSNQAVRSGGTNDYTTLQHDTGSLDHWAEFTVAAGNTAYYLVVNARRPQSPSVGDGYLVFCAPGGFELRTGKIVGGSYTDLTWSPSQGHDITHVGMKIRIECQGSTIRGYLDDVLLATSTDTSVDGIVHGGPYCGINCSGGTIDNFRCGPLPYTP